MVAIQSTTRIGGRLTYRNEAIWQKLMSILATRRGHITPAGTVERRRQVGYWSGMVVSVVFTLVSLYSAWWLANWEAWMWFWAGVVFTGIIALVPIYQSATTREARLRADLLALLRQAEQAASALPDAAIQPLPVATDDGTGESKRVIAPLYRPTRIYWASKALIAGLEVFVGLEQWWINAVVRPGSDRMWQSPVAGVILIGVGMMLGMLSYRAQAPFTASATDEGLSWREGRRQRTLAWSAIRALSIIEVPRRTESEWPPVHARAVYLAIAPGQVLAWTDRILRPRHLRNTRTTAEADPGWLLCRIIVARTGLPLTDLTQRAEAIVETHAHWRRSRAENIGSPDAPASASALPHAPRASTRRSPFTLLAAVLAAAVIIAGIATVLYEPRAYAAALEEAHAQAPLLSDPLSAANGSWPVGELPRGTYTYANGAYYLAQGSNSGCSVYAWAPLDFSNGTLEVTVHQRSSFDLSEAGLVVRAADKSDTMVVFTVTPAGEWHLTRYHIGAGLVGTTNEQELIYDGVVIPVGAIHRGSDATNRLAVIMRGNSYAFFINDQFVGIYHDSGPKSGRVGVYTDGLGEAAAFSNLVVYPAPSPSPLLPV